MTSLIICRCPADVHGRKFFWVRLASLRGDYQPCSYWRVYRSLVLAMYFVGWKPAGFSVTLGVQKINLSGITSANLNRSWSNAVDMHRWTFDYVAENLGAIGPSDAKWRARITPAEPEFLSPKRGDFSVTSQWPIFIIFVYDMWIQVPSKRFLEGIFENFPFWGHFPPKYSTLKEIKQIPFQTSVWSIGRIAETHRALCIVVQGQSAFRAY